MRKTTWSIALLIVLSLACFGRTPAELGSRFSEAYTAFAPLYSIHRSYADHLFSGADVAIPNGLDEACDALALQLAQLQLEMILQTESQLVDPISRLARMRADVATFCDAYQPVLVSLSRLEGDTAEVVESAGDAGMFAAIADLNRLFEGALDATIESLVDDEARWTFGVTFACRTLILQARVERVDLSLKEILFGGEGRTDPPFPVSPQVLDAMRSLAALSGRTLSMAEAEEAASWAATIFEAMMRR